MRSLLWSITLCAAPALAGAESLPASIRACAAETDSLKRLVCYDREVARFPETKQTDAKSTTKHEPTGNPPSSGASAPGTSAAANIAAPPPPATSPSPAGASHQQGAAKDSGHISAQIVSIDHIPNELVVHLDNGEVWQEMQSVPGDLSLRVGDTVKIDKRLGSYWLTGPHVSAMKVRQKE
jgi:hypothetical protein